MKIRYIALLLALVLSALGVAARGAYLKYEVIRPLGLPEYSDKSILELPFLAHSDEVLKFMLENTDLLLEEPEPSSGSTGAANSTQSTVPSLPAEPSVSTEPSSSEVPTEPSATVPTVPPTTQKPTTLPTIPAATGPKPATPTFDFPGEPVDQSWYDNVLFLGNSRTCGLRGYGRSGRAEYFADYGLTMFKAFDKACSDKNFKNMMLEDLLRSRQYDAIVVQFGLNEVGYHAATFRAAFQKLLDRIRSLQPDAKLIIMGIMGVTRGKYAQGEYWHPDNLQKFNDFYGSLANGTDIFYVDPNYYFTDNEGFMYESLTEDGYHLNPAGVKQWKIWLDHEIQAMGI